MFLIYFYVFPGRIDQGEKLPRESSNCGTRNAFRSLSRVQPLRNVISPSAIIAKYILGSRPQAEAGPFPLWCSKNTNDKCPGLDARNWKELHGQSRWPCPSMNEWILLVAVLPMWLPPNCHVPKGSTWKVGFNAQAGSRARRTCGLFSLDY